ncbi:COX assembly mitochondrial protein homolog isoform X3 [Rattus norvegicus]|uniref:COX assembly mitochondrial protein homolog isoform X3 n=1 Tax=Rattus norvegicus TaxID=10116 RepID=UPI0003D0F211|nr:COX assembly mitochondrial protein homolog isoform X3 [Rattus norvegicus]|eukprot:XP_006244096.1 PREDICTED: COX assembly mitochondrial protein homolog isoform X1 [Rattus norvegicus]
MALDPAEQHLRHVEKDVLIPKIMREKARERCSEQVEDGDLQLVISIQLTPTSRHHVPRSDFTRCCKDSGILMVLKCRKENSALKDCLTAYYNDPAFYEECKLEYLKEREEFRRTGVPTKKRLQKLPTSM